MTEITFMRYDALMAAVRRVTWDDYCDVYAMNNEESAFRNKPLKFGVNWTALGTVSASDAKEFSKRLAYVAELADQLTRLEIVVRYGTTKDSMIPDSETYKEVICRFENAMRTECYSILRDLVTRK